MSIESYMCVFFRVCEIAVMLVQTRKQERERERELTYSKKLVVVVAVVVVNAHAALCQVSIFPVFLWQCSSVQCFRKMLLQQMPLRDCEKREPENLILKKRQMISTSNRRLCTRTLGTITTTVCINLPRPRKYNGMRSINSLVQSSPTASSTFSLWFETFTSTTAVIIRFFKCV